MEVWVMESCQEVIVGILSELVKNDPEILREFPIGLPNIVMPTMGGTLFWKDVAEIKGWRMQKHIFTAHWRLLDPKNMRYAWGVKGKMVDIFVKAARSMKEEEEEAGDSSEDTQSSGKESDPNAVSLGT
jgi:hypothetical protein